MILAALVCGALLPQLSPWAWLIRWILVVMLFVAFLDVDPATARPVRAHLRLLLVWPVCAGIGWAILRPFGEQAALAGFLVGATPTATAAPVITALLGGQAGFVTVSVLGSNLLGAILLPLALTVLPGTHAPSGEAGVLVPTLLLIGVPLAAAQALRHLRPATAKLLLRARLWTFPLWVAALALAASRTSAFLMEHPEVPRSQVVAIFAGSALLCALNFAIGRRAGRPGLELEAGQSIGQKNTMLTLWLGLAAAGPVAALGPASYVLWHNLWNGWQLSRRGGNAAPESGGSGPDAIRNP